MNILVTGGAGFIGSHIHKLLLDQGHSVSVYDNLSKGYQQLVDSRAKFIQGDLSDEKLLYKSLVGIESVIHLASLIEVPLSIKNPVGFAQNNIMGSIYLLEAMVKAKVKKIVFSSTAVVYGNSENLPLTEQAPLDATNPYGASKISVEAFLASYHHLHNFDVSILRYFNPFGPFELHQPETHAIPNFIKAALKNDPIPLYWQGEQVRDFIYVEDLAQAHIAVLKLTGFNIFNVGTEKGVKVKEVVNLISKILGRKLKIEDKGPRLGDAPANYASGEKLKKLTQWLPKYSLEEGLKKTIEWFKNKSSDIV